MPRGERFDRSYGSDDLNFDLQNAGFPGIELDFCLGDGSFLEPYEFNWQLSSEMFATADQVAALAKEIINSVGGSNNYFHVKANGITFIVILDDPKHTGSLLIRNSPFKTPEEKIVFRNKTNELLRGVVRSFQKKIQKPIL